MEQFQPRDTTQVQKRSLEIFMAGLGYQIDDESTSFRWVTDNPHLVGSKYLSFSTAQALHNATTDDWEELPQFPNLYGFKSIQVNIGMPAYDLVQLYALKLVQKTKFMHTRKGGHRITLKSPMIKPAHPLYAKAFGLL
jgi:hypothetical protein